MAQREYSYAAAFIAFAKGDKLEDISETLGIPLQTLRNKSRDECWRKLATQLQQSIVPLSSPKSAERDIERIKKNREDNIRLAEKLRVDAERVIDALLDNTLTIEHVNSKGLITNRRPNIQDRTALAGYVKTIAETLYRAHGDVLLARETDALPQQAAQVVINLPAAIARPRAERELVDDAKPIIELRPPQQAEAVTVTRTPEQQ